MKKKLLALIILITASLALIIGAYDYYSKRLNIIENWMFTDEQIEAYGPFWIQVPAAENDGLFSDIDGIQFDEDGSNIYLIFPEDVKTDKLVFYVRDGYESNYEARRVANFEKDGTISLAGKTINMIKTDVPIMYIDTDDENMPFSEFKFTKERDSICTGNLYSSDLHGPIKVSLKPRGNVTWSGPVKKPYSISIDKRRNIFGLGEVKNWNLLADYFDLSLMRNFTINKLAHAVGVEYEPNMTHTVLFINGEFEGLYLLSTKVQVDREAMKLKKDDWLVCWGATRPEQIIPYESKSWFSDTDLDYPYVDLKYPKEDSEKGIKEKQAIIQEYMNAIEDETSDRFLDYLDIKSMAKCYWVQEFSMNIDAAFRSTYSFWDSSAEKMHFAPVWDFDYSLGVTGTKPSFDGGEVEFANPEGWKVRNLAYFHELFEHPEFVQAVNEEYFREGGVRDAIYEGVNTFTTEKERIEPIANLDYSKYSKYSRELELFPYTNSYDEYVQRVFDMYTRRLQWIDNEMTNNN
ncbi:MAG: CotH kinase family protein [Lachnospiraceae bacterium]|nr:CotH kinase family protein [Lachnospiraceae bacterium]